jgi:soluble lytic murein transglycosylase-like protein
MASYPYAAQINAAAATYGIDPNILAGLLYTESNFNPSAISSAGAQGIAQFMPATAAQYGVNTSDPTSSINGAAHYLSDLYNEFGSWPAALTAYNAGPGNVSTLGATRAATVAGADPNYAAKVLTAAQGFAAGAANGAQSVTTGSSTASTTAAGPTVNFTSQGLTMAVVVIALLLVLTGLGQFTGSSQAAA